MLNLSRSILLNIPRAQQEASVSTLYQEVIPESFSGLTYPGELEVVRKRLVSNGVLDEQAFRAFQIVRLTRSSELESFLQLVSDVLTFDPKSEKFFASPYTFPVVAIDIALNRVTDSDPFSREIARKIDIDAYRGLATVRRSAQSPVLRVGAVALMLILYAGVVLGETR